MAISHHLQEAKTTPNLFTFLYVRFQQLLEKGFDAQSLLLNWVHGCLTFWVPRVTNINFLLTTAEDHQE